MTAEGYMCYTTWTPYLLSYLNFYSLQNIGKRDRSNSTASNSTSKQALHASVGGWDEKNEVSTQVCVCVML